MFGGSLEGVGVERRSIGVGGCDHGVRASIDLVALLRFGSGAENPGTGDCCIRARERVRGSG